jgi:uncharacterized protein (TIGR02246 family)
VASVEQIVNAKETRTREFRCKQTSIPSAVKYVDKNSFVGGPTMKTNVKKRVKGAPRKLARTARKSVKTSNAAIIIRQMGNEWAEHWNAGALDNLVAAYAPDAVYLPPHHEAIHGRDAIREYLRGPLSHGVSDLAFDVTYIKQEGNVAWDVGTYRVNVPLNDGTKKEDHGKYLTVWKRVSARWLIAADAWSSDLPA